MKKILSKTKYLHFLPAVCILVIALILPSIAGNDYVIHLLNTAMISLIAVYGLNFITGMAGQMNLGTAGIFGIGAYTSGILTVNLGISPWLALLVSVAFGLLIGVALGYPSLRVHGVFLALTTVAFTEIVRLGLNNWRWVGAATGLKNIPNFVFLGSEIRSRVQYYYFLIIFVVVFSIITHRIIHSKWGRAFIAVRDNMEAVESCGINLSRVKITAFTIAAVFGTVAGSLHAHSQNYINPVSFTMERSTLFVIMMMFGGVGNMYGCVLGVLIITLLPEALRGLGGYYQLIYAVIVLLFAVFLPGGIVSMIRNVMIKTKRNEL